MRTGVALSASPTEGVTELTAKPAGVGVGRTGESPQSAALIVSTDRAAMTTCVEERLNMVKERYRPCRARVPAYSQVLGRFPVGLSAVRFRFGAFTLDLDTRQLLTGDHVVHIAPKAFDLLTALVLDRPKVLSKKVLLERLWPDTFVSEANLSNILSEVREALGDNARSPLFV